MKDALTKLLVAALAVLGAALTASAQDSGKFVLADFEQVKDNLPVSNQGGPVRLTSYQESGLTRVKGLAGTNPPAPELVRLKQGDPNRAAAFDFEITAPNQYAGAGVEVHAMPEKDGKPAAMDASAYKSLTLQLYATGAQNVRVEFVTRGQGMNIASGHPQMSFKVKPGFNTYQIPFKSLLQPAWAETKVSAKEVLKKLTAVGVTAYCEQQCVPTKGTLVIDNMVFQN